MNYAPHVVPLMRQIRPLVLPYWGNPGEISYKSGVATDVVTELDTTVETYMAGELKGAYPEIGFVGEEFGGDRAQERFWLMDPIDGTGHFVRGLPFCTSMLALIERGEVVFSVIYDFVNDIAYWAEKGEGAFKNGEPIQVSERSLADAYYSCESNLAKGDNEETARRIFGNGARVSALCAGWEFAMVAEGKLDARIAIDPWGKDYDFAPGSLLVAEAGGIVRNIGSNQYDYTNLNFVAGNPRVVQDLVSGPLSHLW